MGDHGGGGRLLMNPSFLAPIVGNAVPELGATFSITSATNVFLTPASLGVQSITMTVLGQSVFLPPSYSIVPGQTKFNVKNNGTYPFGVRDSLGNLLTSISGSGSAIFALDNSSNWSFTGTNLEPGLITIDNTFSSTFTNTILSAFLTIDNNTSIHFAGLSSGYAAFIVDNLGKVITTPTTVDAALLGPVQAYKINSTQFVVITGNGTSYKATVLTINGTSPNLSLSVGTAAASPTIQGGIGEDFISAPKFAQLSPSLYLVSWSDSVTPITSVAAFSIAGTTVTWGSATTVITSNSVTNATTTYPLTSTTGVVLYLSGASAPFNVNAVVVSVAGTTCTVNTPAAAATTSQQAAAVASVQMSSTKVLIIADGGNVSQKAHALTIAGTTVTWGAALVVEVLARSSFYTNDSATRYNPHLWQIGTNTAGLWYLDGSGVSRTVVLNENAGVITAGTISFRNTSTAAANAAGAGFILPQGITEFMSIKEQLVSTAGFGLVMIPSKINGTNITQGASRPMRNVLQNNPITTPTTRLASGDYLILPTGAASVPASSVIPVFRSNGDYINYRGEIACPAIASITTPIVATESNRIVILGSDNDATTIGVSTLPLRVLNVEIAQ
jgi:hypothetical protein